VGRPEGKRPVGRLGRRWEDNIKMRLREMGWEGVNCMYMASVGLVFVKAVMKPRVP
jgi:hypothetical protein